MKTTRIFTCIFLLFSITSFGQVPRKVLHEAFTGSNCGPCAPSGDSVMNVLHQNEHNYTIVKYQLGSDPYYTAETVSRVGYYQPGGSYSIPYMSVDGNSFKPNDVNGDGSYGPHPVGCTYCDPLIGCPSWSGDNYSQTEFSQAYVVPAYLELDVSDSVSGQTVYIEIDIRSFANFDSLPGSFNRLHVMIMEDVTYNNTGTNGQTEFHYVMKKMVPNQTGTIIGDILYGDTLHYSLSYTFNGNYDPTTSYGDPVDHSTEHTVEDFSGLSVIAFVQNFVTKEVYQSEWTYETAPANTWDCDPVTGCNDPGDGSGAYTTLAACELSCIAQVYSWDCDPMTGCYNPGNDSGAYSTLAECELACNATGIINNTEELFSVYPSPSDEYLFIDYFIQYKQSTTLTIYNMMGEVILNKEFAQQVPGTYYTRINVSNYSKGIYILKLRTDNKTETKKILVN